MIRFDTLDKKPKVWSIIPLSAIAAIIIFFILTRRTVSISACSITLSLYLAAVIAILMRAFVRQLRYNPSSYNTI